MRALPFALVALLLSACEDPAGCACEHGSAAAAPAPAAEPAVPASALRFREPDPEVQAACQAGCAAEEGYDPADVVAQPGAEPGDLARCPVSGVVFRVHEESPQVVVHGHALYTCCGGCAERLRAEPARFVVVDRS
jgi:hypothetical protein